MCQKCKDIDWDNRCAAIEMRYPSVKEFFDTWAKNCGASRKVFVGHTVKMLNEFWADASKLAEVAQGQEPKDDELPEALLAMLSLGGDKIEEDVLMALRLCYYVKNRPLLADATYDRLEKAFTDSERCGDESPILLPGSSLEDSYAPRVRALALYLILATSDR